jgi:hypothetical protein
MRAVRTGPRRGGMLKDAKIVMQSRSAKRPRVGRGTGRGGPEGPKSRAKVRSLIRVREMLAVEEAANFMVPDVTRVGEVEVTVEVMVSSVLAVR